MKSDCLSFSAIPHTSRLFRDFLYDFPRLSRFYSHPPELASLTRQASALDYDGERRRRVAGILERQNRAFGCSPKTLENIGRFAGGASAALTGQQVALFGGPMYSMLKAVSAVGLAEQASQSGTEAVPIFWLATEDHDLNEVNHALIPGSDGKPRLLLATAHGVAGAPVGDFRFGAEIEPLVAEAAELLGDSTVSDALRDSYRPGESFGSAFGRLFARLFGDLGLIILDASDPELRPIAEPILRAALLGAGEINQALLDRGVALRDAGYHEQVKVTSSSTLLFQKKNGARLPIHRANGSFTVGQEYVAREDLLAQLAASPQDFSPNVLLRPVVQDHLFPTLAYVGGPSEVAYFAQAAVVYEKLLGRVTPVLPRFSATLVDARAQRLMSKYHVSLADLFAGPEHTRELLATRSLPPGLQSQFDQATAALTAALEAVTKSLETLDPTLVEAASRSGSKILYQLQHLRSRAASAELRRAEEVGQHADWLSSALYPNKDLQEREISGISFVARHGLPLLQELLACARGGCPDHQVLHL